MAVTPTEKVETSSGGDTYSHTIEYLKDADLKASLDGVATTAFTLPSGTSLKFNSAPASGVKVRIYRDTDVSTPKHTFAAGSSIKANDLNKNHEQLRFRLEEEIMTEDIADEAVTTDKIKTLDSAKLTGTLGAQSGANLTNLNADNISSGTVAAARVATLNQDTTGSAAKLTTARTIGGVSFDGSANINLPGVNAAGNQNTTGSAAKLTTARTIGGVSFDGSANINLPGVNAVGDQNTTGSAATLTTARNIGGVAFDGSANINLPGVNAEGDQDTTGNAATSTKLAATKTIGMTGDVVWTSAGFDGSGNVTGTAAIGSGVIVNDDIKSDAAIALTKLGTGALPSAITVASANIVDLDLDTVDLKNDSVTHEKLKDSASTDSDRAVTTNHIRDNAVTAAKLNAELGDLSNVDESTSPTDTQTLVWDNTAGKWKPGDAGQVSGSADGTLKAIKNNDSQIGNSDITTLDFSSDFTVAENPDKEIQVGIAALVATNKRSFSQNYSIPTDSNASSVGPITIANGYAVTAADANTTWLIH